MFHVSHDEQRWDEMITRMGILKKVPHLTLADFQNHWETVHGPIAAQSIQGLKKYHQNHVIDAKQRGIDYKRTVHEIDGFSQLSFDSTEAMTQSFTPETVAILDADEKQFIGQLSLLTVSPFIVVPVVQNKPLIKRMSVLKRKATISVEAFQKEWADVHAYYVKKLSGIQGYIQNHILDHRVKRTSSAELVDAQIDGVVEMWFETVEQMERAFRSEEGRVCMLHAETFIEEISTFIVEPKIIIA